MLERLEGRVLDYGCGYGDLTFAMSQTHPTCGADIDAERVSFARKEYAPLEFQICDAEDAPYPDGSFDIVTSVVVVNSVPNAQDHLRSIRRLLKPGGQLILVYQNLFYVRSWIRRCMRRGPIPYTARMWPRPYMLALLKTEGFRVLRESHFYDPPFEGWKNPSDLLIGAVKQFLSFLQVRGTADYLVVLAEKIPDARPSLP